MNAPVAPAKTTPPLVWPNGQLMRAEQLSREVAAPRMASVRSILSGHPAAGLDPRRLANILRSAEEGDATSYLELAEEMEEKDLHYLSVLGTRKRAVAQLPIEVEAAGDAPHHKEQADFVRRWLKRDMLQQEIFDILDAVGKGYSATELIWRTRPGRWLPHELKRRDPRFFEFDRINGETLRLRTSGHSEPLAAGKFIVHFHPAKSGLPIRGGLARAVAWGWMFKNFSIKDWVSFLETYGMPLRVGRYDNGETEANIAILARAVADLGADAAAVFPKTMEVEFIDGKGGSAPGDLWRSMAQYIDDQISKAVLGQTNTTDAKAGGLGSGQADVHNDVRKDIRDADAMLVAATLNRDLVIPMIMFNFGPQEDYPRLSIGEPEQDDVKALTEAAVALVPLGMKVGMRSLREKTGLPEPVGDEEVLTAPANSDPGNLPSGAATGGQAPLPPRHGAPSALLGPLKRPVGQIGAASASPVEPRSGTYHDGIDEAVGDFLDDWSEVIEPIVAPIEGLVASATSLEGIRDGLVALFAQMDETALVDLLAQAGFAARLGGEAAQQRDERASS